MTDIRKMFEWETNLCLLEVKGDELLVELTSIFEDHLVLPTGASTAMALCVMNTYVFECGRFLPRLLISSPVKGCGKTTALSIIVKLVSKPLSGSNMTPAIIFRTIDSYTPTLILDEADTFLDGKEEMYGILNAGHSRMNSFIWRCTGDSHEPQAFNVFAPLVIAMIGHPKNEALQSRCIIINMKRRTLNETIKTFNPHDEHLGKIRGRLSKWSNDYNDAIKSQKPIRLGSGDDRYDDNWEPLLGIASLCGDDWLTKAKSAALVMAQLDQNEDFGPMLLEDIKVFFADKKVDRLQSKDLVGMLRKLPDRPWGDWPNGRIFNERALSGILRAFSISPKTIRVGEKTAKGYLLEQFEDAFKRYTR